MVAQDNQMKTASKKAQFGWALFDWASSPVPTLHATFVFAVYFSTTIAPENGTVLWAQMTAFTSLAIALVSVFAGRFADSKGLIKHGLTASLLIGAVAVMALWYAEPDNAFIVYALLLSALSIFMMEIGFVFYNALLVHMVPTEKMGRLSGIAWGVGYVGAVVALSIALACLFCQKWRHLVLINHKQNMSEQRWYLPGYGPSSFISRYFYL